MPPIMTRRQFLAALGASGATLALGLWGCPTRRAGRALEEIPVVIGGEDNRVGHLLRDGHRFPIPKPARRVEVVVVGAGVAGLTAAYQLKDAELLVLEKEPRPGGHARKDVWHGVTYGEGAAYIADVSGYVGKLIDELRIPLVAIAEPGDGYYIGGKTFTDFWDAGAAHLPISEAGRQAFKRFHADMRALDRRGAVPPLPVEEASATELAYDRRGFAELLAPYGPEVRAYMDLYCRSALGGPVSDISAYWGLNFYSGEFGTRYTAPGGNAIYAEALARAVGRERILTGSTLIRVENVGDRVHVTHVRGDEVETIEARQVVMATPKQIAKHLVAALPADQQAAMAALRYEPYLVANVLVDGPFKRQAYDTWREGAPFADLIVADWTAPHAQRTVLTAYCPVPFAERYRLLDDRHVITMGRRVVAAIDEMAPGTAAHVVEVRAFRRGHPMVCSAVGALHELRPAMVRSHGRIHFAHSDNQVAATIEAAVHEGRKAGLAVRKALAVGIG